jgi:hypothetical protein
MFRDVRGLFGSKRPGFAEKSNNRNGNLALKRKRLTIKAAP